MNRFFKAVLLTGLLVGVTDLLSAYISQWIKTGKYSEKMLNYIAGGGLGLKTSMEGGNAVQFLGLFFHFFICYSFTLLFFWVFPRLKFLSFNKYMVGFLYGIFVALMVNQVILKLTPLPTPAFNVSGQLVAWFVLATVLGIPIAHFAYKYYGVENRFPRQNEA
jgi:hypothetical protein